MICLMTVDTTVPSTGDLFWWEKNNNWKVWHWKYLAGETCHSDKMKLLSTPGSVKIVSTAGTAKQLNTCSMVIIGGVLKAHISQISNVTLSNLSKQYTCIYVRLRWKYMIHLQMQTCTTCIIYRLLLDISIQVLMHLREAINFRCCNLKLFL